jgi:UDP-N-acetylglucosamine acyltransferase
MASDIHTSAVVDPAARLGEGCTVGPFAYIGPDAKVGDRCVIGPHCVLHGNVTLGSGNWLVSHVALGGPPQDISYAGEPTAIEIADDNVLREFVTVNRGTKKGGGVTRLGSGILLMAYSHVAHDCQVGDGVIFANAATLAGHVVVGKHSHVGAFSAVHQFCRVGDYAFIGGFSVITKDALPFVKTVGARGEAQIYGINSIGLERKGFPEETVDALKSAYRVLFQSKSLLKDALIEADKSWGHLPEVKYFLDFIRESKRGIQR